MPDCMKCGQQQSSNTQIISATQKINSHGRKEIELTATQENYVTFGDDHKYHCIKCGASFTYKELCAYEIHQQKNLSSTTTQPLKQVVKPKQYGDLKQLLKL